MTTQRIIFNNQTIKEGNITTDQWSELITKFESRYNGTLTLQERKTWIDNNIAEFKQMLTNTKGYLFLKDRVITPWETIAEVKL